MPAPDWSWADWDAMRANNGMERMTAENAWWKFAEKVNGLMKLHVPTRRRNQHRSKWMNREILRDTEEEEDVEEGERVPSQRSTRKWRKK